MYATSRKESNFYNDFFLVSKLNFRTNGKRVDADRTPRQGCKKQLISDFLKVLGQAKISLTPFFRRVQTSVQNMTTKMIFSNDELHIILKRRN